MAKMTFNGLHVLIMLFMVLSVAFSGVIALPTGNDTTDSDAPNSTNTTYHASLLPRGGIAENLPDNGQGPSPAGSHKPGGPYDYDQYCESSFLSSCIKCVVSFFGRQF